jgi:wyosine [tRNA(Phe)-imidazoG37] synthetase (radical SAM superfamily)
MYRYLFGPVPSRRLGISLGIDLLPMKTCTLNCIYCECGRTTDLTVDRKEYVPLDKVKAEYLQYLAHHPLPDYVTFSGSGEPTLNRRIGEIIRFIQSRKPAVSVAVLTNGTLFSDRQVRFELKEASVVIPSLDAATDKVFRKINRPYPRLNTITMIDGLVRFRREYHGQLWLEVFILPGLNDTTAELTALKQAIERIAPDRIQLNTLDRPGAVNDIRTADRGELERVLDFWNLKNAEIIARAPERRELVSYRKDTESAILETIARRPCTLADLTEIVGLHTNEVNKYLDVMEADKKIEVVKQDRGFFYRIK